MRLKILRVVNVILLFAFLDQAFTGFFPQIMGGLGYRIHVIGAWVIIGSIIAHLILNWGWIQLTYFGRRKSQ